MALPNQNGVIVHNGKVCSPLVVPTATSIPYGDSNVGSALDGLKTSVTDIISALQTTYPNLTISIAKITYNNYMAHFDFQFRASADIVSGTAQVSLPFTLKNSSNLISLGSLSGNGFIDVTNNGINVRCTSSNGQWLVGSATFFIA